jgi:predicted dehydrogenase
MAATRPVDNIWSPSSLRLSKLRGHLHDAAAAAAGKPLLRVGMVGLGSRGTGTLSTIEASARLQAKMNIVALADVDPAALQPHKDKGYALFGSASELIQSGLIDTLLIVTPHYYHTTIGAEAFQAGLHVLTEKPISVHKADAEKLIAAYEARPNKEQKFAAMFNNRNNPTYNKVRDMVASGELGKLQRVNWIITTWFRPQAYYDRGGWRG